MKKFIVGLVMGLIVAFPLGMNVGKGVPLLSNPFSDKPLSQQIKDTAKDATETLKKKTNEVVEDAKDAVNKATE